MIWVKVGTTGTQATSDLRIPLVPFYVGVRHRRDARGGAGGRAHRASLFADGDAQADPAETGHGS